MQKELSDNNLRTFQDTIPDQAMFVYTYFTDHLLSLAQKDLPTTVTKRILKDTLRGIATLHDKHIVHTGTPILHKRSNFERLMYELQISRRII